MLGERIPGLHPVKMKDSNIFINQDFVSVGMEPAGGAASIYLVMEVMGLSG